MLLFPFTIVNVFSWDGQNIENTLIVRSEVPINDSGDLMSLMLNI